MIRAMTSDRHRNIYTDGAVCFWTSSIIEWIPVFKSRTACLAVLGILDTCRDRYGVRLLAYVLMPDHIHLAVWSESGRVARAFLQRFLALTASEIASLAYFGAKRGNPTASEWLIEFRERARGNSKVRVWKERGRAFPVTERDALVEKVRYIHENPVRKGLVLRPEDWEFSSAQWYAGGESQIPVDEIDW
jgi:putative transposase